MQKLSSDACQAAGKLDSSGAAASDVVASVTSAGGSLYERVWSGCGCKMMPVAFL